MSSSSSVPLPKRGRKPGRTHTARLEFRLPPDIRAKIETAASLSGQKLSDFAVSVLLREAETVIERQHQREMSRRDFEQLLELLANPPEPNEALKKAAERYKRGRVEGDRYYFPDDWDKFEEGETPPDPHF